MNSRTPKGQVEVHETERKRGRGKSGKFFKHVDTASLLSEHISLVRYIFFFKHVNTATHVSELTSLVRYIFQTRGYRHTCVRAYLVGRYIFQTRGYRHTFVRAYLVGRYIFQTRGYRHTFVNSEHTSLVRYIFQTRGHHNTFVRTYLVGQVHFFKHVNTATHVSEHTSLVGAFSLSLGDTFIMVKPVNESVNLPLVQVVVRLVLRFLSFLRRLVLRFLSFLRRGLALSALLFRVHMYCFLYLFIGIVCVRACVRARARAILCTCVSAMFCMTMLFFVCFVCLRTIDLYYYGYLSVFL